MQETEGLSSPFPGMDPYEDPARWPDVHQRLITYIADTLQPQIRWPRIRILLREPDSDVTLDLPAVFTRCYDNGGYGDLVD